MQVKKTNYKKYFKEKNYHLNAILKYLFKILLKRG